jgi:hypothetical protein
VGLNGTVVSLPHDEQDARVSTRSCGWECDAAWRDPRWALQARQRFGSFLNCLSAKNACSPAVHTKSEPQSLQRRTLS